MAQRTASELVHVGRRAQAEVVHGGPWTQAARGVAGRASVRLCFASSYHCCDVDYLESK